MNESTNNNEQVEHFSQNVLSCSDNQRTTNTAATTGERALRNLLSALKAELIGKGQRTRAGQTRQSVQFQSEIGGTKNDEDLPDLMLHNYTTEDGILDWFNRLSLGQI